MLGKLFLIEMAKMPLIRKPSILLLVKVSLLASGLIVLDKMASTLKILPWLRKLTGNAREETFYQEVNFTFVEPSVAPRMPSQELLLLVLVSSAPGSDYQFARSAIRNTWGNSDECRNTNDSSKRTSCRWKVVYLVGKSYNESLDSQIKDEAQIFNDILVGNFHDSYVNLVIKLFMGFSWASKVNCRFVLKADDDIYVRVPKLVSWLRHAPSPLYAGHVHRKVGVSRDPKERNPLPPGSSFNEKFYPPYCLGAFYVLSRSVIPDILKAVNRWRPWPIEDTYIGVLARDVGVSPTDIYGFVLTARASRNLPRLTDCQWACTIALGHRLTPSHLQLVHGKFESLLSFNSSGCAVDACSDVSSGSFYFIYILLVIAVLLAAYVWMRKVRFKPNIQWFLITQ